MYEFLDYRVEDVMTRKPVTIAPEATLAEAERLFGAHDFNGLPVLGPGGALVGFLTKLDVLRAFRFTDEHVFPPYAELMEEPVSTVMSRDVLTVTPRAPLTRVLQKMLDSRSRSFPVVDDDRLVGIVAREDLLGALRRGAAGERPPATKEPRRPARRTGRGSRGRKRTRG